MVANFLQNIFKIKQNNNREEIITYSPQQNESAEGMNGKICIKNFLRYLWAEIIRTSAYELKISPTNALKGGVPVEKWYGKNDLSGLRVCIWI